MLNNFLAIALLICPPQQVQLPIPPDEEIELIEPDFIEAKLADGFIPLPSECLLAHDLITNGSNYSDELILTMLKGVNNEKEFRIVLWDMGKKLEIDSWSHDYYCQHRPILELIRELETDYSNSKDWPKLEEKFRFLIQHEFCNLKCSNIRDYINHLKVRKVWENDRADLIQAHIDFQEWKFTLWYDIGQLNYNHCPSYQKRYYLNSMKTNMGKIGFEKGIGWMFEIEEVEAKNETKR